MFEGEKTTKIQEVMIMKRHSFAGSPYFGLLYSLLWFYIFIWARNSGN